MFVPAIHFFKLSPHLVEVHWRLESLRIEEGNKQENEKKKKFQQTCKVEPFSRWVGIQVIFTINGLKIRNHLKKG